MRPRFPILSVAVFLISALTFLLPSLQQLMVYDRDAIFRGEWWRLFSFHFVHFSLSHLIFNLAVFGVVVGISHQRGYRGFGVMYGLAAIGIGMSLPILQPGLQFCGGLSGVATATVVLTTLHGLTETGPWRWICLLALVATGVKMAVEFAGQITVFASFARADIVPVPLCHVAGALAAAVAFGFVYVGWPPAFLPSSKICVKKPCAIPAARVGKASCH